MPVSSKIVARWGEVMPKAHIRCYRNYRRPDWRDSGSFIQTNYWIAIKCVSPVSGIIVPETQKVDLFVDKLVAEKLWDKLQG